MRLRPLPGRPRRGPPRRPRRSNVSRGPSSEEAPTSRAPGNTSPPPSLGSTRAMRYARKSIVLREAHSQHRPKACHHGDLTRGGRPACKEPRMFESAELGHTISKERYKEEAPALREALLEAQYELLQAPAFPVIILVG